MENKKFIKELEKLNYEEVKKLKSACLIFSGELRNGLLKPIFDRFNALYEEKEMN